MWLDAKLKHSDKVTVHSTWILLSLVPIIIAVGTGCLTWWCEHLCARVHGHAHMYMYHFPPRPLHVAARNGLTMVVQELLGKGASVLAVDENGK